MNYSIKFALSFVFISVVWFASSCSSNTNQTAVNERNSETTRNSSTNPAINQTNNQTNNSGQLSSSSASQAGLNPPILPDAKLTPGDTLDVTKNDICVSGYSKKVRDVPQQVKEEAYKEYGITHREPGEYEVDHLISLELGGSNSVKNLWAESYRTEPWNARVKDKLENRLHEMICSNQIDLKVAQHEIASNWIDAYKKYISDQPAGTARENNSAKTNSSSTKNSNANRQSAVNTNPSTSNATGAVVGNKNSHIYHLPGCPDYDKVSPKNRVEFQSAKEAEAAGYRLAGNCRQK